jgi:hypothetical protein
MALLPRTTVLSTVGPSSYTTTNTPLFSASMQDTGLHLDESGGGREIRGVAEQLSTSHSGRL